jgi:signal peptidase I
MSKQPSSSSPETTTSETTGVKQKKKENPFISFLIAVALAVVFRSFAFEPFNIPSGSMKPTLLVGDYIFVSKYSYGYSRYSFPFGLPLFEGRFFERTPVRGDIVVFKLPTNPKINYIKRLIGLPGDTLQMTNGVLYLNGAAVPKEKIAPFTESSPMGETLEIPEYVETLPGGVAYRVLDERPDGALDDTPLYTVPEGHYMMLGDNRDNSQDSRVLSEVGFVPEENLVGPARMIFFSSRSSLWKIWDFRMDRYFKKLSYVADKVGLGSKNNE